MTEMTVNPVPSSQRPPEWTKGMTLRSASGVFSTDKPFRVAVFTDEESQQQYIIPLTVEDGN